jgi:penicillin amidase
MKKINFEALFPLLALVILVFALSNQMFKAPPVGKLLDPFIGFVQNEREEGLDLPLRIIDGSGVSDTTHIFFDDRKVPHIYARSIEDMYFAQGYVTASLRLWQMDFLSYVASGRLAEIVGDMALEQDRRQRRIGIPRAAEASLKMMDQDPETHKILTAYTKGVNAYVRQLNDKSIPLEYKLLDYKPEPWTNLKTVMIMKYMANILSGYEEDHIMTNMILALGERNFNKLFPGFCPPVTPIVDDSGKKMNPSLAWLDKPGYLDYSFLSSNPIISKNDYNPALGSNSWVVSGKKTRTGYPILSCDPHLDLSFPAIWMETQLTAPGMNVYGVCIPGIPTVVIGFNEDIAWGITNGEDDIKDWYKLKLTDGYKKYEMDGTWLDLDFMVEPIKVRSRATFLDTVYHTMHGPVVYDNRFAGGHPELVNYAMKWELHNASNELLTFIKLNRAKNYVDYRDAIRHYNSPVENFTFACRNNDIAVDHQGKMPVKWPGQGRFILDGSDRSHLYTRYIPEDSLPHVLNPSSHYVLSANQHPTDMKYPYYYNGYYRETRANTIGAVLQQDDSFDIGKMEAMQLDNANGFARAALPVMLSSLDMSNLTADAKKELAALSSWNGAYDPDDERPELFELWWKNIREYTWDELRNYSFDYKMPDDYILLTLIRDHPADTYFDIQGTPEKEDAGDIIRQAFLTALTAYNKKKADGSIKWGDINKVSINHLCNIGPFSTRNISSAGCPQAINAISPNFGPSWRMIVELGPRPKGYGIYPGGQSGNPGSAWYDNFVKDWNKGSYYPLRFFMSRGEAKTSAVNTWILQ